MKFHIFVLYFCPMKWRPTCYKIAPDNFENGPQHAIKWCPTG